MSLGTLLRVAAIIGGFIWTLYLIGGWMSYSDMLKLSGGGVGLFASTVEAARTALIIQSILAGALFLFGIFYKPKNKPVAGVPHPDTHVKCPDCREFVLKEATVCKHCGCKLIPQ